jgi:hypothetical protein
VFVAVRTIIRRVCSEMESWTVNSGHSSLNVGVLNLFVLE